MASISLPRRRGWDNLQVPCEAPLDRLRPRGKVGQRALSSPFFLHPVPQEVPSNSRCPVRPRLLTRFSVLPTAHRRTGANISRIHKVRGRTADQVNSLRSRSYAVEANLSASNLPGTAQTL